MFYTIHNTVDKTVELKIPSKLYISPQQTHAAPPMRRASDSMISFPKIEYKTPRNSYSAIPFSNIHPDNIPAQRRPSILLVEDSVPIQKLMAGILKKNQCEVDVAENGQIGLSKLEKSTYDIVMVDFEMPVMTGPGNIYIYIYIYI